MDGWRDALARSPLGRHARCAMGYHYSGVQDLAAISPPEHALDLVMGSDDVEVAVLVAVPAAFLVVVAVVAPAAVAYRGVAFQNERMSSSDHD